MADYAPSATSRIRWKYVAAGVEHHILVRSSRTAGPTELNALAPVVHNVFAPFASLLPDDFEFIQGEYALADSDVFLPTGVLPAAVTGTVDVDTYSPTQKITATTFSGRSTLGHRARISLFGVLWDVNDLGEPAALNGVVTGLEVAAVATASAALSGDIYAIDNTLAYFYNRATIKSNDKLLKLVRRGILG